MVLFQPSGRVSRWVLITGVLHVPQLSNNLLFVLTLTSEHGFKVTIYRCQMSFLCGTILALTATVNDAKIAYLHGNVIMTSRTSQAATAAVATADSANLTKSGVVDCELPHHPALPPWPL